MDDIKTYLESEDKSYSEGVELLKKHGGDSKEIVFLSVEDPSTMHAAMLIKRLANILRIASQKKSEAKPAIEIKKEKPIIGIKNHFSKAPKELTQSKELTNKLLARKWGQLDEKEKAYFKGDAAVFDYKRELLFRNSAIESELKTLHASLPHAENDEQRKEIADKLVILKKEQNDNWAKIDDVNLVIEVTVAATKEGEAELLKKRNNLRSYVSKLEKQVNEEPEHKNFEKRKESLENAKTDLDEVEKALSV